jgi:hypothetical protein
LKDNFDWQEKYEQLINDPKFIKEFDNYIRDLINKVNNTDRKTIKVDEDIYTFIQNFIKNKRKRKINQILRKKDI